jgi:hypothetical protein
MVDGVDLRPLPLEARRAGLVRLLQQVRHGLHLSEHVEAEGPKALNRRGCPGIGCGQARGRRGLGAIAPMMALITRMAWSWTSAGWSRRRASALGVSGWR